jgi:hypothetical protein
VTGSTRFTGAAGGGGAHPPAGRDHDRRVFEVDDGRAANRPRAGEVERPQACGPGAADTERHDLGLGDRLGMAVGPPVERVEGALRAGEAVGRGAAERHGQLERLTAIAHVDQGIDPAPFVARSPEEPAGFAIEAGHLATQVGRPDASRLPYPAPPKVVADVGEEQAEGRCDARVWGQDHA